jgi:hypothetical protein
MSLNPSAVVSAPSASGSPNAELTNEASKIEQVAEKIAGNVAEKVSGDPASPAQETAPKQDDDASARFAALMRKERKLTELQRQIAEKEKKFEKYEKLESEKEKNPFAVLETHGLTLEKLIEAKMNDTTDPREVMVKQLQEQIKALQDRIDGKENEEKQKHTTREVQEFKDSMRQTLEKDPEKFGLIASTESFDAVFDAIREIVAEDPDAYPTRADAEKLIPRVAEKVEESLYQTLKKLQGVEKAKKLFQPQAEEPVVSGEIESGARASDVPERTLTNSSMNVAPATVVPTKPLSREESLARASKFLEEQLRKKNA